MDTANYSNALIAIFNDRKSAEDAREELLRNGLRPEQVQVNTSDDFAMDAASGNAALSGRHQDSSGGGISGFFHRLFGTDESDQDRAYYSDAIKRGHSAVVVHAPDNLIDRAADILNASGAVDVETEPESTYNDNESDLTRREFSGVGGEERALDTGTPIPVVNEELRVGKRAVRRGGVRVYSNITEQPVEQSIGLREERVRVERRPVDREATAADLAAAQGGVLEVTETVEEPVIEKRARVVEEVVITKDVSERTQNVRDTVRRSDVRVEDTRGNASSRLSNADTIDTDFRDDFRSRYEDGGRYEDYAPAYQYGYQMASDPRYEGRSYDEVENDLRTDYMRTNPNSTWERIKGSVRYGWEKVTGKR